MSLLCSIMCICACTLSCSFNWKHLAYFIDYILNKCPIVKAFFVGWFCCFKALFLIKCHKCIVCLSLYMSYLGNGSHLGKFCVKSALIKTICSYITDCFILLQQLSLLKTGTTTVHISGVYWRGDWVLFVRLKM